MVRKETFDVSVEDEGLRLDQVIARRIEGLSRRKARVAIDLGGVFLDRSRVKVASRPVKRGQRVDVHLGAVLDNATGAVGSAARAADAAELPPYLMVHQDAAVIVVDKPAGLVTAPTPESDRGNLLDLLQRAGLGTIYLVHRIDRPTSGLLVFARTGDANRVLGAAFERHAIERRYRAVVAGALGDQAQTIDRPIQGRRAVTHVAAIEQVGTELDRATVITATLETGRTHQIRIHLAGLGHPLLGDPEHGGEVSRRFRPRPPRLALHAEVLGFAHPSTGAPLRFESPLPTDLATWMARLRNPAPQREPDAPIDPAYGPDELADSDPGPTAEPAT